MSKYGQGGGRFPQVSGITFVFNLNKEPHHRIDIRLVKIQNEYLNLKKTYRLATNLFMKNVDEVLKECPIAVNPYVCIAFLCNKMFTVLNNNHRFLPKIFRLSSC